MNRMSLLVCTLTLLSLAGVSHSDDTHKLAKMESCEPVDGMDFICGPVNSEDLVWLPGRDLIIASSLNLNVESAKLYFVDPATRSYGELYPGDSPKVDLRADIFDACPGAPDLSNFETHGLSLLRREDDLHWLYATAHGSRESVEVFEIDSSDAEPVATWIGCVTMPEDTNINAVTALADGGFLTTRNSPSGWQVPDKVQVKLSGVITGFIYEWRPGEKVREVPGTELAAPNGIVMSPDGKWVFVASWGSKQMVRYVRQNSGALNKDVTLEMDIRPDNLSWTDDGKVLTAGYRQGGNTHCKYGFCIDEWEVVEIDPINLTSRILFTAKPIEKFKGATAAIRGHEGLWIGTYGGDRIVFVSDGLSP